MLLLLFFLWTFGLEAGGCFSKVRARVQPEVGQLSVQRQQQRRLTHHQQISATLVATVEVTATVVSHRIPAHGRGDSIGGIDPIRKSGLVKHVAD